MGKNKLERFAEMKKFENVLQPSFEEIYNKDHNLKGKWNEDYFKNTNPIVLELGCGKGEYTVGLAEKCKTNNFIGVDIKGARMWRGASHSIQKDLTNVAFLRTRIELINSFFDKNEISEIWITFPDPQLKKRRNKKRLTAARFLNSYKQFLKPEGFVHLKTDNNILYEYTIRLINHNNLKLLVSTTDLYGSSIKDDVLDIKTYYEQQFIQEGLTIKYLKFQLSNTLQIEEPDAK